MIDRVKKSLPILNTQNGMKQSVQQNQKNLWLPNNLSGKILDLQFQCQTQNLNRNLIDQLVEHYSKAVQFYNERGNSKYKIYQKRMQLFLCRPRIQQILKGRTAKYIIAQQVTKNELKLAQSSNKQQAQQLINESEKISLQVYKKMRNDLKKQEQNLEQRIRRKRTNSNKSTRTDQDDQFGIDNKGETMNVNLLLDGINQRNRKVFF